MNIVSKRFLFFLTLVALVATAGCDSGNDDDDDSNGGVQTFSGTMAGSSQSGALTLTIEGTEATGTLTLVGAGNRGSAHPPLTGTFNPSTGALTLSGGGFTFTGTISGNTLSGTWTGPDGSSGTFTTYLEGSSDAEVVRVYCGTFDGNEDDGTLNIVTRGTDLVGVAVEYGDDSGTALRGRVSGSSVTVWVQGGSESQPVATGTLTADRSSVSGTFNGGSNSGTWQAALCGG